MLIKKLNATTDAITQAALVSISRERARQAVSKMVCPNKLLSLRNIQLQTVFSARPN